MPLPGVVVVRVVRIPGVRFMPGVPVVDMPGVVDVCPPEYVDCPEPE